MISRQKNNPSDISLAILVYCCKLLTCLKHSENRRLTLIAINKFNIGQTEAI